MDGSELVSVDGTTLIDRFTNNINDSAESFGTDGHQNRGTAVGNGLSTHKTLGRVKSNGSDVVATKMLGNLENESVGDTLNFESVKNWGKLSLKLHVDDGTNNLGNLAVSNQLCAEATYTPRMVSATIERSE